MALHVFPTTDLNLLAGMKVRLRFFGHLTAGWTDLETLPGFTATLPAHAAARINRTGARHEIEALLPGEIINWVELRDSSGVIAECLLRIRVHRRLRSVHAAATRLDLEEREDRAFVVYGELETHTGARVTAELTGLPYFKPATVTVTSGAPHITVSNGRIAAGPGAGEARVRVEVDPAVAPGAAPGHVEVPIKVVAEVTDRPILTPIPTPSPPAAVARTTSILFVAEGFTTTQRGEFEGIANAVGRRLLTISPYSLVAGSIELYHAFVASREDGVTIGPPVQPMAPDIGVAAPVDVPLSNPAAMTAGNALSIVDVLRKLGHPTGTAHTTLAAARTFGGWNADQLTADMYNLWTRLPTARATRLRDTFFGMRLGERHDGTRARRARTAPNPASEWLAPREANVVLAFDERRLPDLTATDPRTAHLAQLDRFLRTLRTPSGPAGMGARWAQGGDSRGLVVMIVRCDAIGGQDFAGAAPSSMGGSILLRIKPPTIPGLSEVEPQPRPLAPAATRVGFADAPLDHLADVVAHEVAHAFSLLDEYEAGELGGSAPAAATANVESGPNTHMRATVATATGIDPTKLKWNRARIELAAATTAIAVAGANVEIGVARAAVAAWRALPAGRRVILRSRGTPLKQDTLSLKSVTAAGGVVLDAGTQPTGSFTADYPAGSTLLLPRVDAGGATLTFVDPAVATALRGGPFLDKGAACVPALGGHAPAAIPGLVISAAKRDHLIAAYVGGATFACGVLRPSAICKMRDIRDDPAKPVIDFCHVCKATIVEKIDPAQLAALDREYPR